MYYVKTQTYVCHLTFNLWPHYLAKETLLLLSMQCYYVKSG